MIKRSAFKFEVMAEDLLIYQMNRYAGCCRFVANKVLAIQKANYETGGRFINYVTMAKQLSEWRNSEDLSFLKEAPYHALQHAIKDIDRAFKNFFLKRAAYPKFKKKNQGDIFRFPDSKQIKLDQENARIFLPKLGWVRYRKSRDVVGELCNVTLSKEGDKWLISIQTEMHMQDPVHPSNSWIGIDVGVIHFATLNDGQHIAPINSLKQKQKALAKYQKRLSRKERFSKNWQKARKKVAKVHRDIRHVRSDFLHKVSTDLCKKHAVICIEDLNVKKMTVSHKGTQENPGQHVSQKSRLNKRILDQGWGLFRRMLEYKTKWLGAKLIQVPPRYTSQECPSCGHIARMNRPSQIPLFKLSL